MRPVGWGLAGILGPVLLLAAYLLLPDDSRRSAIAESAKPELHLLTGLPLLWADEFKLEQPKSVVVERLRLDYRLTPIDLPSGLPEGGLLLAAQPRALPAEELVALDAWVRRGGRLVLLADPLLEWPSELAPGDRLRPPFQFADTGLLQHWGLRLDAPDKRGPRLVGLEVPGPPGATKLDLPIMTISPGSLVKQGGTCLIQPEGLYADCPIGKGRAWIIADADWLNEQLVSNAQGDMDANLAALGTVMRATNPTR